MNPEPVEGFIQSHIARHETLEYAAGQRMKAKPIQNSKSTTPNPPLRILTAVPICDGHDSAINTINLEFVRHGIEVIYLGYHRSARDIVRAAIQEDVRAIGISSYNGGHVQFFAEVIDLLKKNSATDIGLFGGGGGTITSADARIMEKKGVDRIFFAGTPLAEMVDFVRKTYGRPRKVSSARVRRPPSHTDRELAKLLSASEAGFSEIANPFDGLRAGQKSQIRSTPSTGSGQASSGQVKNPVVGITGPGGAGKTTLIDELVLRFLKARPQARLAILSHDPSLIGQGALLGDRAAMIYSQDDRVFMRSLATRGQAGGLSENTERCLRLLKGCGFDLVLVETVGIGQEAMPFRRELVDQTILVMSPDYGSRLQLQKIVMLDVADIVVVNKSDLAAAKTAASEVEQRLTLNQRGQKLICTMAKRHGDAGVNALFQMLKS